MNKKVLVISNPEDKHTETVLQNLYDYNCDVTILYPEDFGTTLYLSLAIDNNNGNPVCTFGEMDEVDYYSYYSVWYRRPRLPALSTYNLTAEGLDFSRDEWKTLIHDTYSIVQQPLWVSHPVVLAKAANKPLQLQLAHSIGLNIPKTLITNNPKYAKEFIESCDRKVIVKATGRGWVYTEDNRDVTYVLTNRLSEEDINQLDQIAISPVTIQEEIPKAFEIRANVVGQKCISIKIDSQRSEVSKVDWRRYDVANTPYSPFKLPQSIEEKVLLLCQKLELEFGAVDLICTPSGEYVFLEVNGNGQFLWAEQLSGTEISGTLARLLAGIDQPLKNRAF